ncbi:peroxiredoxin [Wenyingzhuangia heitensis]|uniref:Peroxiredoxin n=1 Tax=Wenyingzhuangia heitensis TaxID=1487859 RepID=A0ABX0UEP8_9FLAO|nr:redoxin domain-containing protein [Wenyingzhuangia heitensis]NIJ46355.1 peroxiredoxin [Wenyingzhuangia heitensis]
MKKNYTSVILLLLFVVSTVGAQENPWKYESANRLQNEVSITYQVVYEKQLNSYEKQYFPNERVVTFNKDFMLIKDFSPRTKLKYTTNKLLDYNEQKLYVCTNSNNYKRAVSYDFEKGKLKAEKQTHTKEIEGLACDEYIVILNGVPSTVYSTKKIGLKYCENFDIEGFVLEYPFYSKKYGRGKYVAKKINNVRLPKSVFSLKNYTIYTKEEWKEYKIDGKKSISNVKYKYLNEKAPRLKLKTLDKLKVDSKKRIGKQIILNFSYVKSGACKNAVTYLNEMQEHYKGNKNVLVLSLFLDDPYDVELFKEKTGINYQVAGAARWYADRFEINRYPATLIIDNKGTVSYVTYGLGSRDTKTIINKVDNNLTSIE